MNHAATWHQTPLDVRLMRLATSLLGWALVALVLGAAGWWAVRHPVWTLRGIEVEGDVAHQNEVTFRAHLASKLRGSFVTLNLAEVREAFEDVPWVRSAVVQRLWPNRLKVTLTEHRAVAWWGEARGSHLVNDRGEVFEVGSDDDDTDRLPELAGPDGQANKVKALFDRLTPWFASRQQAIERLELTAQGSWRVALDSGARIELGRGDAAEVEARLARYLDTVDQVTGNLGRKVQAADLRYPSGYAVRLLGVTTLDPANPQPPKAVPKAPPKAPAKPTAAPASRPVGTGPAKAH